MADGAPAVVPDVHHGARCAEPLEHEMFDAAVAAWSDSPLEPEIEIRELIDRHDIAAAAAGPAVVLRVLQTAVGGAPALGGIPLRVVGPPAVQRLAVEQ